MMKLRGKVVKVCVSDNYLSIVLVLTEDVMRMICWYASQCVTCNVQCAMCEKDGRGYILE